jgi:glycosyltransferase involved in cell wall biosynthesis
MIKNEIATFIIPHYFQNIKNCKKYLSQTLEGIYNQTDTNWHIVIIDDCSPDLEVRDYLIEIQENNSNNITVLLKNTNDGAGVCRNIGIEMAFKNGSPFILFNDADDISHCKRLEIVRSIFNKNIDVDLVYSTFKAIDEENNSVLLSSLPPTIMEQIESHNSDPPQGLNAWLEIGTVKGYSNLTSSTSVRIDLAMTYPFPPERVSEDSHTWMRYSAGGKKFYYTPNVPTLYRIPQNAYGSASWEREGGKYYFLKKKAEVDTEGFKEALEIAKKKSKICVDDEDDLLLRFHIRLAETFAKEKENNLVLGQIDKAFQISKHDAVKIISQNRWLKEYIY